MDQFNPQTIVNLLIIGVVLIIAVRGFIDWCKRIDAEWAAKNPPPYPPELSDAGPVPPVSARDKEIAAVHVAKILPASLRMPLAQYRDMSGAAKAVVTKQKQFHRYAGAADSEGGHHD